MDFAEKLRRLAEGRNKSDLARAAGLTPTVISNYINRGSLPRADIAMKIARATGAPLDWLVDDTQDWPPPDRRDASPQQLSDRELMMEVATRYRRAVLEYLAAQEAANKIDWAAAAAEAERTPPEKPLPETARRAELAAKAVMLSFERMQNDFYLSMFTVLNHESLPGSDRPLAVIEHAEDSQFFWSFKVRPDVSAFADALYKRPDFLSSDVAVRLRMNEEQRRECDRLRRATEGQAVRISDRLASSPTKKKS